MISLALIFLFASCDAAKFEGGTDPGDSLFSITVKPSAVPQVLHGY